MARKGKIARKTKETDITVEINLDGSGAGDVKTPIPFFDHMLASLARHGLFDLKVRAKGDVEIDLHHTVEDVGLCIGEALKKALGAKTGIARCGSASMPMMDALASVVLDLSGRPYLRLSYGTDASARAQKVFSVGKGKTIDEAFNFPMMEEFMKALSNSACIDLHVELKYGTDVHHSIEALFKALGRALGAAAAVDKRIKGVLSTKGKL